MLRCDRSRRASSWPISIAARRSSLEMFISIPISHINRPLHSYNGAVERSSEF